jgi:hypothetical protein
MSKLKQIFKLLLRNARTNICMHTLSQSIRALFPSDTPHLITITQFTIHTAKFMDSEKRYVVSFWFQFEWVSERLRAKKNKIEFSQHTHAHYSLILTSNQFILQPFNVFFDLNWYEYRFLFRFDNGKQRMQRGSVFASQPQTTRHQEVTYSFVSFTWESLFDSFWLYFVDKKEMNWY